MWKEFKDFAVKGNIIDMAVGIIIGTAFSKIVNSLVNDVVMPMFSMITGKVDFTNMFLALNGERYKNLAEAKEAAIPTLNYGVFISAVIDFLIIALTLFFVIRRINKLKKQAPEPPPAEPTTKDCPFCWSTIPIRAIRCPHCTSRLEEGEVKVP